MPSLPTGTVTFLLTDIEGSTRLWETAPAQMRLALAKHDAIIEEAVAHSGGVTVKPRGEGDSRFTVFQRAADAVTASAEILRRLHTEPWQTPRPIRVRIGIHTGVADLWEGDYYGRVVNKTARLRAIGHGGQGLLSLAAAELVQDDLPPGLALRDLGEHRLKDLERPEHVYQLIVPDVPAEFPSLDSLQSFTHNFPTQLTPLIGREKELRDVCAMLGRPEVRLITLTGPGGTGKTRLGVQAAAELLDAFPQGVFFVPLADAVESGLVVSKVAQQLGVREGGAQPLLDSLKDYLRERVVLLVLDNFEQVHDGAAVVVGLLEAAPRLKVLVTSRGRLHVRGEHEYAVPALALPVADGRRGQAVGDLIRSDAVQLFVERARSANPRFALDEHNAAAVGQICSRLDGLPLAIELAAARVKFLSPQAMLERLQQSLTLLVGGPRDLPARQQTLRGTIDWSYRLLDGTAQETFPYLGIFAGGFTLPAAEAVCDPSRRAGVLEQLETLLDNSLLVPAETHGEEPRFRMLETIREYALERLETQGALETARRRHAVYFADKTQELGQRVLAAHGSPWLDQVEDEHDNIRAMLAWIQASPEGAQVGPRLLLSLFWFWYRRGYTGEARGWSEKMLPSTTHEQLDARAAVFLLRGMAAQWQGDSKTALAHLEQSVHLWRTAGDNGWLWLALLMGGVVRLNQGNNEAAKPLLQESLQLQRELGVVWGQIGALVNLANVAMGLGELAEARGLLDEATSLSGEYKDDWYTSIVLANRGELARMDGDYERAGIHYEDTERLLRQMGDKGDLARCACTRGYVALHMNRLEEAQARFQDSLAMFRALDNRRGVAECLVGLACLAYAMGGPSRGARILGAAQAILTTTGARLWPADQLEYERLGAALRTALGDDPFGLALAAGSTMSVEQSITVASQSA